MERKINTQSKKIDTSQISSDKTIIYKGNTLLFLLLTQTILYQNAIVYFEKLRVFFI